MEILYFILDNIKLIVDNNFFLSTFLFFIFLIFYNSFSIPGSLLFIAASGYFFGLYVGFVISIISVVIGSFIFFLTSKYLLKKLFPKIYNNFSNKINNYIKDSSFEYFIIFRIIPGTPLFIQNLCLSIINISIYKFIISTFIGLSPSIFLIVFIGNQVNNIKSLKELKVENIFSIEFLLFVFTLISLLIIRIFFKKKKINT